MHFPRSHARPGCEEHRWRKIVYEEDMTHQEQDRAQGAFAHDDLIRIVELYVPPEMRAAAPAPPHLIYNGGPLLTAVEVFTVFWGSAWQTPPQSDTVQQLNA